MNPLEALQGTAMGRDATRGQAAGEDLSRCEAMPAEPAAALAAGIDSLVGLLAARVAATPDRAAVVVAVGPQASTWTWADLAAASLRAADDLLAAGLVRGDRLAHIGPHSPDWIVVDLACLLAGIVHVPLHADATAAEHRSQIAWLNPRGVVVSGGGVPGGLRAGGGKTPRWPFSNWATPENAECLRGSQSPHPATERSIHSLPAPISLAPPAEGWLRRDGVKQIGRADLTAALAACAAATDPDACCTIVLSSGTTGLPHGVLHSSRALLHNTKAVAEVFLPDARDVRLSWLPASHALARVGDLYTAIERGGCLSVVSDRTKILDACRALPPTVILGVPAFFERLEAGVRQGRITNLALALGGEIRVCISGGAPLRRRTAEFFQASGLPLVEGYGLAEAGPVVALASPRTARPDTVGPPLAGIEVRFDDDPDRRGQLLVRTPSRALGVIHPEGVIEPCTEWLETGDLASLDEAGHLRITGRLKDIVVLASGVKIPPAEVERALAEDEAVAQVCVVGDSLAWPVALVVPEPAVLRRAIRRLGLVVFSRRQALRHPRLLAWLARRLARHQRRLPRSWRVRRVALVGRAFDRAQGEVTDSLKLRRGTIAKHFAATITSLAADPPPAWAGRIDEWRLAAGCAASKRGLVAAVWQGASGCFASAATAAAMPPDAGVEGVLERAAAEIAHLRATGRLYEPPRDAPPPPPIEDPPPAPLGLFSAKAEAALGETGLWGLAVPEQFGGSGASMLELARAITRLAADVPTAAGLLAVHSSIGAVSAIAAFGTPDQQARHLPGLATGRPLSIFAATEPDAGCDLSRVQARLEVCDGRLLLTGTKMFITGATYGRLVKLLAVSAGKPTVVLVSLPEADTPTFRLRHYALHPLQHAHNAALEFTNFEVHQADVLTPSGESDGMPIVWHGLNRGRTTLAAQAAGTLRLLLARAVEHAVGRSTWGLPIATRQLVQGRLGRIAAAIVACDAMSSWAATAIDAGGGEWEAITAKVVASSCVREGAIDALGIHGGRAFLVGHPLGDSLHDHFAVGVYEGESDLLGLALFRGLAKGHPQGVLPRDAGGLRRATAWLAWRAAAWGRSAHSEDGGILDGRLRAHARAGRTCLAATALDIDRAIRRHGRKLAERQLEIGDLAARVRELASVLAVAHHADACGNEATIAAADVWCRLALARVGGHRPRAGDLAALAALGTSAATS
jgi:long-subunit acyl-CoA synthetase (AMP-forming)/alkylation response protein AidB-like acyl-CoA dehydrogenase